MTSRKYILKYVFSVLLLSFIGSISYAQEQPASTQPTTVKKGPPQKKEDKPIRTVSPEELAIEHCQNGESNKKLTRYEAAIADFDLALEVHPEYYKAYTGKASTHFLMLDFQSALQDYNNAITMMENKREHHLTQAKIKKIFKDVNGETIELNSAAALKPDLAEAYFQRGNVKQFTDDRQGACEDLRKSKEFGYNQANDSLKEICGQ